MAMRVSMAEPSRDGSSLRAVEAVARRVAPDDAQLTVWFRKYAREHRHRLALDLDLVRRHAALAEPVLEIGSNPPILTGALKTLGYDVQGVDLHPERFHSASEALRVAIARCDVEIEPLPFAEDSFGAVLFNEIFEHLRINPVFTMREVLRVTRPGGLLLLSTPNLRSLDGLINFLFRNRAESCSTDPYEEFRKLETLGHMGHAREYTSREVVEFLSRIGFHVEAVVYRPGYVSRAKEVLSRAIPQLRPFMTVIARKTSPDDRP